MVQTRRKGLNRTCIYATGWSTSGGKSIHTFHGLHCVHDALESNRVALHHPTCSSPGFIPSSRGGLSDKHVFASALCLIVMIGDVQTCSSTAITAHLDILDVMASGVCLMFPYYAREA